ncbi:hypothetical protein Forpe1208_v016332 [Fusarium oxysporum f. sp. rapae]|uniref:GRF-like zinc ribbon domain-containing protein n=1 Tax=Fusarium oxysporum f. sp. rapae TaxID=485398 RepID=A0A8J5NP61_FUSOX|nr:hypothetical protein Forpe1208_v016332 [Fusarium oxysporum f. sp. rapae]
MSTLSSNVLNLVLAPAPTHPPICFMCNSPSQRFITRSSNRNGNAGRPFDKCTNCRKFLGFADERGNVPDNPLCHCGESSKTQVNGQNRGNPGGLHFVCRLGTCDYYAVGMNRNHEQIRLRRDMVEHFANLKLV